jgi:hypothetical protein
MGEDYGYPEKRKSKADKRAKARYMRYKRGGAQRITGVAVSGSQDKRN